MHFETVEGIQMFQDRVQWSAPINKLMNLLIPCKAVESRPTTYP
jgi:hypothetical protein